MSEYEQPAFPTMRFEHGGLDDGMSLLDYFAAKAMQAYINNPDSGTLRDIANDAYETAEYMMEIRDARRK